MVDNLVAVVATAVVDADDLLVVVGAVPEAVIYVPHFFTAIILAIVLFVADVLVPTYVVVAFAAATAAVPHAAICAKLVHVV